MLSCCVGEGYLCVAVLLSNLIVDINKLHIDTCATFEQYLWNIQANKLIVINDKTKSLKILRSGPFMNMAYSMWLRYADKGFTAFRCVSYLHEDAHL